MKMFAPFRLERFFARHEFSSKYLLCTSDCESMSLKDLAGMESDGLSGLSATWLGYTESKGDPCLRDEIAGLYNGLGRANILVHSGAEEAILNLSIAIIGRGDTVIVNTPCYQSLSELPSSLGARVFPWRLRPGTDRWLLDPDELEGLLARHSGRKAARGRPPVVVLNTPHNPTGALMSRDEFGRTVEICRKYGAVLLCDEVYRLLETDGRETLPSACEVYENAVSLCVLSKAWGLAGLRIGWLATRREDILDMVAQVKDYNSICASAPSETLARIAVRNTGRIVGRNREICRRNLAGFKAFFERHGELFSFIPPAGGSVAFPRLLSGGPCLRWVSGDGNGADAEILAMELLKDTGALLLPGRLYGCDPGYFRIGFGRSSTLEALAVFDSWLGAKGL